MRQVPQAMTDIWKAEDKTGPTRRPIVRATVAKGWHKKIPYDTALAPGGNFEHDRHRNGNFSTAIFGTTAGQVEIRNIKSYTWSRSINSDVAECTITCKNTDLIPIGEANTEGHADDFELPGYQTPTRGGSEVGTVDPNPWGYTEDTGWRARLVPDRIVRTFEGYGMDPTTEPARDVNLMQSGTWLIDTVKLNSEGDIEIRCRDIGRLLLDQIVFPPIVPPSDYPLSWSKIRTENVIGRDVKGGSWTDLTRKIGSADSSNSKYVGVYDPTGYVGPNGGVNGHHHNHALEGRDGAYWLSTGQSSKSSKVWWEFTFDNPTALNGVRIRPKGGPYRIYISLKTDNGWIGRRKIPYEVTTENVDLEAGIPFVYSTVGDRGRVFDAILKRKYGNVKKIRITFSRLEDRDVDFGPVGTYTYYGGLEFAKIYTAASKADLDFGKGEFLKTVGNYSDFTDIVKWACAWAGFFWPPHSTGLDFIKLGPPVDKLYLTYAEPDPVLPKGRVWGDFMNSGTAGEAPLTSDLFDKQPLMNMIQYIRDLLGFIFFIDETGGVVWRMPNKWELGNYLSPTHLGIRSRARTTEIITIDEAETLKSYSTTLDGSNQRERIFIANSTGKTGIVIKGFVAHPQGMRRVAGWTDQHFATKRECRVMADMVAANQMFDYRRSQVRIAGYPAIQVDDQVRIFERVTNETYYHYVESITSTLDLEAGTWHYDLETHWLGEDPTLAWVVKVNQLDAVTRTHLNEIS